MSDSSGEDLMVPLNSLTERDNPVSRNQVKYDYAKIEAQIEEQIKDPEARAKLKELAGHINPVVDTSKEPDYTMCFHKTPKRYIGLLAITKCLVEQPDGAMAEQFFPMGFIDTERDDEEPSGSM